VLEEKFPELSSLAPLLIHLVRKKITNCSKNQSSDTDSGSDHKMGDKRMEEKKAFSTQLAMKIKVRGVCTLTVQDRKAVAHSSLLARAQS
jgi:hypothetical protein